MIVPTFGQLVRLTSHISVCVQCSKGNGLRRKRLLPTHAVVVIEAAQRRVQPQQTRRARGPLPGRPLRQAQVAATAAGQNLSESSISIESSLPVSRPMR